MANPSLSPMASSSLMLDSTYILADLSISLTASLWRCNLLSHCASISISWQNQAEPTSLMADESLSFMTSQSPLSTEISKESYCYYQTLIILSLVVYLTDSSISPFWFEVCGLFWVFF
jgi:MarR-like DNA-binding transcriptional regulator SgrR of sgrS sRNA